MTLDRNSLAISAERNHHVPAVAPPVLPQPAQSETDTWDLNWVFGMLSRRAPIIAGVALGASLLSGLMVLRQSATTPPVYTGQFDLLVEPVTTDEQLARQSTSAQARQGGASVEKSQLDYETQIRVLRSPSLLNPLLEKLQQENPNVPREVLEQRFLNALEIERVAARKSNTKIIQVSYAGSSPELVMDVLNQLSQLYLQYSLEERKTSLDQAIQFIDEQLPELSARVNSLQSDLEQFRIRNVLIDPTAEGGQLTAQAATLKQQRLDTNIQLTEARARYNLLRQGDAISVLNEASEYGALLTALQQVETEIAAESARSTEENPSLQLLRDRQRNILQSLNEYAQRVLDRAENQIQVAESRQGALVQTEQLLKQQIQRLPTATRQYTDLQRELEIASSILNEFTARRKALQIDAAQQNSPWELLNPPSLVRDGIGQPRDIAAINQAQLLIVAAVLSSLLGLGAGLLVEVFQDHYYKPGDVKRGTKLSVLESIPPVGGSDQHSVASFVEAFRSLATKLTLIESRWPLRSLVVTSSQPKEGKSTIALNLALAAAATGQRVLLVDAALRRPAIHHLLNLPNEKGLTELLSMQLYDFKKVIQRSPNEPKLSIMTAGQELSDPTRLLSSEAMQDLAAKLQATYDLVIYDTSPVMDLADASLVGACSNGVILVVGLGKVSRTSVAQTIETLMLSKLPILGTVANFDRHRKTALTAYEDQESLLDDGEPT